MSCKKITLISFFSILVLAADRLTKYFIIKNLSDSPGFFVFQTNNFAFKLIHSINDNLTFSIPFPNWLAVGIIIFIIIALLIVLIKKITERSYLYPVVMGIIISSAVSNLIDRIWYNGVVDFISLKFWDFQWAVFNLADVFISLGILILLILELKGEKYDSKTNTSDSN